MSMTLERLTLAKPRGFCAGVDRAIEIVEKALEIFGRPVYVRKEIVHNRYVVEGLKEKGAIFVDSIDEIPLKATTIFSAHGVSPQVWADARAKQLQIIDATCPLVTKVHLEVKRFVREGYHIILIGHEDHDEIIGTRGEAPGHIQVISNVEDVESCEVPDPERVVCLTQTTLSVDDAAEMIKALLKKFPRMVLPPKDDICYATQNRQVAVKDLANMTELILVIGSPNSSNSARLREVAEAAGAKKAILVSRVTEIDPAWFENITSVGITAGASTPEFLVHEVVSYCQALGDVTVKEIDGVEEDVKFVLPQELMRLSKVPAQGGSKGMWPYASA
ncbi:MAG: 4-hydroxy-3-methylbut-2-enyl diphosphate reductase [Candidatus Tectomicrobia bacterium]|nr:4-hydroxy-3-methylbut-2-enyl diphosphate reductase [Candidatus Tectomicrobia bacterium]